MQASGDQKVAIASLNWINGSTLQLKRRNPFENNWNKMFGIYGKQGLPAIMQHDQF